MTKEKKAMLSPVACTHCGSVYDLCSVTPIARYADCTVFKTPCCDRVVDDRKWKGLPDIRKVDQIDRGFIADNSGMIRPAGIVRPNDPKATSKL